MNKKQSGYSHKILHRTYWHHSLNCIDAISCCSQIMWSSSIQVIRTWTMLLPIYRFSMMLVTRTTGDYLTFAWADRWIIRCGVSFRRLILTSTIPMKTNIDVEMGSHHIRTAELSPFCEPLSVIDETSRKDYRSESLFSLSPSWPGKFLGAGRFVVTRISKQRRAALAVVSMFERMAIRLYCRYQMLVNRFVWSIDPTAENPQMKNPYLVTRRDRIFFFVHSCGSDLGIHLGNQNCAECQPFTEIKEKISGFSCFIP